MSTTETQGTVQRGECCGNRSVEEVGIISTATRPLATSADQHAVLGVLTDTHSLSRGTRHIFDTAVLPQICFHSSEKGREGRENSGPSNTWKKFHTPNGNGRNWESFDAGLPATHRNGTRLFPGGSVHKPPRAHQSGGHPFSLLQGEDTYAYTTVSGSPPF